MTRLYKVAANLHRKGFNKLAQSVIDLAKKRRDRDRIKDENKAVMKDMKSEDRLRAIQEQHQLDRPLLQDPEASSELSHPTERGPAERRFEVEVVYPSFNDDGTPYFDENSVQEGLVMTAPELEDHKQQAEKGFLKILSEKPLIPRSD